MSVTIWHAGRLYAQDDPVVTAVDHGITVGDGVFETCAVYDGKAFALTRHLRRLARSATGLGLEAPDEGHVRDGVHAVLAAAGPAVGRLRITVTGGPGPLGSHRESTRAEHQTVLVVAGPAARRPVARVVRVPWVRNERSAAAGIKSTSYAENVVALAYAAQRGGDEAIFANSRGELCEGSASNVFVEHGGELVTPPLSSGCLAGITRELLLEWAPQVGIPVREARSGELPFTVLNEVVAGGASLALSGSIRNVVPVVSVDGHPVEPGELSRAAAEEFQRRAGLDIDP